MEHFASGSWASGLRLWRDDPDDLLCNVSLDNGVPCVCIFDYQLIFACVELAIFGLALALFLFKSCRKQKKIDLKQSFLVFTLVLTFSLRFGFLLYVYSSPTQCRRMYFQTSYLVFAPQCIFFLIFIWAIFKLLVVWRGMVANTPTEAKKERKRLQIIKVCYVSVWFALWIT